MGNCLHKNNRENSKFYNEQFLNFAEELKNDKKLMNFIHLIKFNKLNNLKYNILIKNFNY